MSDWRDRIVGARMTVDQEFGTRVQQSEFTRQQWGLVMTAVEFEVEAPDDPDQARMVADTSNLPAVMDELEQVGREAAAMGAGGGRRDAGGGGLLGGVKRMLGLGGDGGPDTAERRRAAEELAQEYAAELQAHLESEGRWEEVRAAAGD
jgi:hypothetical protein